MSSFVGLNKFKVLVVDDEDLFREAVESEFQMLGCATLAAKDGKEAFALVEDEPHIDLIISDMMMPVWDGKKFLTELRKLRPTSPPFIFMTGFSDMRPETAFAMGADAFLDKPIDALRLSEVLEKLGRSEERRWYCRTTMHQTPVRSLVLDIPSWLDDESEFCLGRGGMFVSQVLVGDLSEPMIGQLIKFEVRAADPKLRKMSGKGKVRWVRQKADHATAAGCGIEFEYLCNDCVSPFLKFIERHTLTAFIPLGSRTDHAM